MANKWKRFRVLAFCLCLCVLVLGCVMILWPDISATVVCALLAVICLAVGIYQIIRYFQMGFVAVFFRFDLTLGILGVIAGVLLLSDLRGARALLPVVAGVYTLMSGLYTIQSAVELRRFGIRSWGAELAMGIIDALFAITLIVNPFEGADVLMIFMGISLVIDAIQGFVALHYAAAGVKRFRQRNDTIDVDWEAL